MEHHFTADDEVEDCGVVVTYEDSDEEAYPLFGTEDDPLLAADCLEQLRSVTLGVAGTGALDLTVLEGVALHSALGRWKKLMDRQYGLSRILAERHLANPPELRYR
jgi:hypothetical protein